MSYLKASLICLIFPCQLSCAPSFVLSCQANIYMDIYMCAFSRCLYPELIKCSQLTPSLPWELGLRAQWWQLGFDHTTCQAISTLARLINRSATSANLRDTICLSPALRQQSHLCLSLTCLSLSHALQATVSPVSLSHLHYRYSHLSLSLTCTTGTLSLSVSLTL